MNKLKQKELIEKFFEFIIVPRKIWEIKRHCKIGATTLNTIRKNFGRYIVNDNYMFSRKNFTSNTLNSFYKVNKKVQCKKCQLFDFRKIDRIVNNRSVYVNKSLSVWKGMVCPKCNIKDVTMYNKSYNNIPTYHKDKKCRTCNKKLELSRWWDCIKCKPVLPSIMDEWIYDIESLGNGGTNEGEIDDSDSL